MTAPQPADRLDPRPIRDLYQALATEARRRAPMGLLREADEHGLRRRVARTLGLPLAAVAEALQGDGGQE